METETHSYWAEYIQDDVFKRYRCSCGWYSNPVCVAGSTGLTDQLADHLMDVAEIGGVARYYGQYVTGGGRPNL